ncbi:regulatory protein, luxR family [Chryseobacterium taeanense]|uniref:Regulatory protein, luxR family n=1 Tax=Chryseobacterium taeanense TaxID=311334 RepID=A0A1G8J1W5_9FLAO|nr:helix-turn-helix transcriptional regulator [Chryseobacterium taeanense]SDI25186.1 regulatory protein, luxR family [Chryseobacterium taeanense]
MSKDDVNSFFDHRNIINDISEEESQQKFSYLDSIKAFSRATYTSIYVIDYIKQGFEYVSDNPLFLSGNTPEQVLDMGYAFYFKNVPEKDLQLLLKINDAGFSFYETIPLENRLEYTISYDFHLINKEGNKILINQKLTPLLLNKEGKIWKAICLISLSSEKEAGNIKIYRNGENKVYHYRLERDIWEAEQKVTLSKRELEILRLCARGFTINEIAETIFVSPDTVKFHRRKLFERLEVGNITEAISYAVNNKLI